MIFGGVYLLNLSRGDPDGRQLLNGHLEDGVPTDGIASIQTRRSMQTRRSGDLHRLSTGSVGFGTRGDREGLIHSYDAENEGFGLTELTEDSNEDNDLRRASINGHADVHGQKK